MKHSCNPETEFDCGNGKLCIPKDRLCDKNNDCGNFEDEPRDTCGGEDCGVENGGCHQECNRTPQGHFCSCREGFTMSLNNTCKGNNMIVNVYSIYRDLIPIYILNFINTVFTFLTVVLF